MWKKLTSALFSVDRSTAGDQHAPSVPTATVIRMGKPVPADAVFEAWTSGDLNRMLAVVDEPTNDIDRHFLLMAIVDQAYKLRKNTKNRSLCIKFAEQHITEFTRIAPTLKADNNGTLPRVTTFQKYATLLTEDGQFQRAVEVCEKAMRYGLSDGTKSDFEGRIHRIQKRAAK